MIVVVDDEDRENEGDLTMAAADGDAGGDQLHVDARPRSDVPGDDRRTAGSPGVPLEVSDNSSARETAMCVSIDARGGNDARASRRPIGRRR